MIFLKNYTARILMLLILHCFNNNPIYSMQGKVKIKKDFDATLFQQQLNRLPKNIQRHFITPSFSQRPPKTSIHNNQMVNAQIINIDYRLIPAFFSFDFIRSFSNIIQDIRSLREGGYFDFPSKIQLYHFVAGSAYGHWSTRAEFNPFNDTQFIRNNPNEFLIIGSIFRAETYIHESHLKKIDNLTTEQLNFISDLFKTQFNVNKATKLDYFWKRPKIILNTAQTRLFYSLPQDIQRNLKMNYRLAASTTTQFAAKAPRVTAGLTKISQVYKKYDHQPLVRLAKTAMKAGLVYYGLKWVASSKMLQNRNGILLELLNHKKKFILGTATLIGAKNACEASVAKYVNRRVPALGRFARKANDFLAIPLC